MFLPKVAAATCAGLIALYSGLVWAQSTPDVSLINTDAITPNQARQVMVHALRTNQTEAAQVVAGSLLQYDPRDPTAHYALAVTQSRKGAVDAARKSSRLAFRYAQTDVQRFHSASLSAKLAYQDKSLTWAQYWLRRAHSEASSEVQQRSVERDFKRVRAQNPFRFHLDFSAAPSSNVNNGSLSRYMIIDGVPVIGVNVGDAMALSGVEAMLNARLSYRLNESQTSETRIFGRYFSRRVALSDDAKSIAPGARGSDYAYTQLETGLRHSFRQSKSGPIWSMGAAVGRAWKADDPLHDLARLEAGATWQHSKTLTFSLTAQNEWRYLDAPGQKHDTYTNLRGGVFKTTPRGDTVSASLAFSRLEDGNPVFSSRGTVARFRYTFAKPIGAVNVSAGLNFGFSDYANYRVGFIVVPGGRQDTSVSGQVDFTLQKMQYAGFAPVVTLRALETNSNVSRFDTRQFAINFGIRSSF
ncbi:hypothetical protein [Shimia sp.]|uniref:hypothetical protein n=1 Tax=Shimia sp. TaxID=1954381 RepID=UPI0032968CDB